MTMLVTTAVHNTSRRGNTVCHYKRTWSEVWVFGTSWVGIGVVGSGVTTGGEIRVLRANHGDSRNPFHKERVPRTNQGHRRAGKRISHRPRNVTVPWT